MEKEYRKMLVLTAADIQDLLRMGKNKTCDFLKKEDC